MCLTARSVDPADDGPGSMLLEFLSDVDRGLNFCTAIAQWCSSGSRRVRGGGFTVLFQRAEFWRCMGIEAEKYTDDEQASLASILGGIYVVKGRGDKQCQYLQLTCDDVELTPERLLALLKRNLVSGSFLILLQPV